MKTGAARPGRGTPGAGPRRRRSIRSLQCRLALLVAGLSAPLLGGAKAPVRANGAEGSDIATVLDVPTGSSKLLTFPGLAKVAVGDPAVASVKPLGNGQILVIGLQDGRTTLLLIKENGQRESYQIVVRKVDNVGITREIKSLLGDREGITTKIIGDHIYMEGSAYTQEDYDRVQNVLEIYPNVRSFVKISPNAKKLEAANLSSQFQRAGMKNVNVRVIGSTIFLEGSVESQDDLKRADLITKAMGEKVENLLAVGLRRMIMADVQFVEISHTANDAIGIVTPLSTINGTLGGTLSFSGTVPATGTFGTWSLPITATAAAASLSLLMQEGYARILAQPKLICASGEKAEFLAGGQVPIVYTTVNVSVVEYKDYGISLKLEPTADTQGNIEMKIEGEVSAIDTSVTFAQGAPGFKVRRFKTSVGVRHGESIVLSGVFQDEDAKGITKVPPFSFIPILGELFKQHNYTETKRELVIFVRPFLVTPDSDRVVRMIKDMEERYKEAKDEVGYSVFD